MEETEMTGNMNLNDAIIYLLNCKCAKERRSTNRYQCKKAGLNCTDLCSCSDSRELCMTTTICMTTMVMMTKVNMMMMMTRIMMMVMMITMKMKRKIVITRFLGKTVKVKQNSRWTHWNISVWAFYSSADHFTVLWVKLLTFRQSQR